MQTIKAADSLSRQVRRRELFAAMMEFHLLRNWPRRVRRAAAWHEAKRKWRMEGDLTI